MIMLNDSVLLYLGAQVPEDIGTIEVNYYHKCRVEHKHNREPWILIENPIGIPFNEIKNNTINT